MRWSNVSDEARLRPVPWLGAVVASVLLLTACQPSEPAPVPPAPMPSVSPTGEPGWLAELRSRPLVLPSLPPSGECPVPTAVEPTPAPPPDGPISTGGSAMYGTAAVAPLARHFQAGRLPIVEGEDGWYLGRLHWAGRPGYRGGVLVRAYRIDGPGRARADLRTLTDPDRASEAVEVIEDWQFWGGAVLVTGPGCYAIQIDGDGFTELIVFPAELG